MPIYQADLVRDRREPAPPVDIEPAAEPPVDRLFCGSLPADLCEGPVLDTPRPNEDEAATSDRSELIERLKKGQSPTWIPNRHLESILHHGSSVNVGKPPRPPPESPRLLSPAEITPQQDPLSQVFGDKQLRAGLGIERPRSALHTGDFTHDNKYPSTTAVPHVDRGTAAQWITTSPPRDFTPFHYERRSPLPPERNAPFKSAASPLSSSVSSSFAYQAPTSPLVQSESNDELQLSMPLGSLDSSLSQQTTRFNGPVTSPFASTRSRSSMAAPPWSHGQRREPYQAHQPRRSLTATPGFLLQGVSPQAYAAMPRFRRPSLGSDASPIQHASMVGSYEESILRGRMSTTPSRPFDFLAQIGVLGKGKCKSSLRCPAHVTLPFPAVYYSYGSTSHGRSRSDDGPSPYVGQIDLENGLPNPDEESRSKRKAQSRYSDRCLMEGGSDRMTSSEPDAERRKPSRSKRRSASPKAPPGGSYRVPEKGQVQIVIKNQNKTAVKLFLVPYDLTGMEPGTKTFIRQRSYSAGPVIDHVPNLSERDSMSRPMLRYLVHLHICCPSKGRFYLYKNIRVVFANRVPEGKEKLHNETTCPEPRFTHYKPVRVMHPPALLSGGPAAMLAAEKVLRRRSLGVSFGSPSRRAIGVSDDPCGGGNMLSIDQVPFSRPLPSLLGRVDSEVSGLTSATAAEGVRFPGPSQPSCPGDMGADVTTADPGFWGATQYEKLNRGDLGYGGGAVAAGASGTAAAEGLLSQRLRSLGVKPHAPKDD